MPHHPRIRINDTPERKALREQVLPKEKLIDTILLPAIKDLLQDALLQTLRAEIEVYKAFPKDNGRMDSDTFDPRNMKTCFMGQGFSVGNGELNDADLSDYRTAVGTLAHKEWGDCTLLEAWAGDHFKKYPDMVLGVFNYCKGSRKTLPNLYFHIVPLFKNKETGITVPDEQDRARALDKYLMDVNGLRTYYGMKPLDKVEGEYLEDFEIQWQATLEGKGD